MHKLACVFFSTNITKRALKMHEMDFFDYFEPDMGKWGRAQSSKKSTRKHVGPVTVRENHPSTLTYTHTHTDT